MTDQVADGGSESHPGPNEFLFEQTADCIVEGHIEDGEPIVNRVNDAFEEVFGYPEAEIRGQNLNDFIAPEGKRAEAKAVDREIRKGNIGPREVTRQTADGPRDFLFRAASGDGEYHYAIYTDITERKEYERALERKRARLDEFASFVSHDLRNPLNVAQLRLGLIRQDHDSEHVDAIDGALSRMDTLIEDLLALAREGKRVSETEPVDLATLSSLCWKNVETGAARLETELDCSIQADRSRLRQLLENLIRNAVEHAGDDVTVTIGEMTDGFYVADDGPGIPEADREAVFDAGYSTSAAGTGLGLRIVKQITEAHGWTVDVTEGTTGGSRFEITGVNFVD